MSKKVKDVQKACGFSTGNAIYKKLIEENPIYRDMVLIQIEPCGAETMRVISQAERYVRENQISKGQIWCVYDKDSFPAGMKKVWIGYYEGNTKSRRVQEKCGFKYQWRSKNVDVPLMNERRTGQSIIKK